MQTDIKTDYDAGLPGQLAVLPSFNSAAKVRSCRAGGLIYAGDALKLGDTDNSVVALEEDDTADMICGVAVRSHSNFGMAPTRTYGATSAYAVDANSPQGSCEDGPIFVALKSGQAPKNGDLATPLGRNATSNVMEWGVLAADSGQTRVQFKTGVLQGGVAVVQVFEGALLGKSEAPVVNVTGATVAPTTASIEKGETKQLTASITPAGATDKTGTWTTSDEAIATVDAEGLVTAVEAGAATITFTTTDGGKTAPCDVTVTVSVTGVTIAPTTASVVAGATQQLTATVTPVGATDKTGAWSSSDETKATVDATGLVTGVAAGTATITFTTTDGGKTATCAVTVTGS